MKRKTRLLEKMRDQRGFTLIELVMVIVILGLLAAVAFPIFVDLRTQARRGAELGVVGGVRSGITTFYVRDNNADNQPDLAWPTDAELDAGAAAACTNAAPCFEGVLAQGAITSDWTKVDANTWTGPFGGTWDYNSANGSFTCSAACP